MACTSSSMSAARLFIQLTARRTTSSSSAAAFSYSLPLLDILLPPPALRSFARRLTVAAASAFPAEGRGAIASSLPAVAASRGSVTTQRDGRPRVAERIPSVGRRTLGTTTSFSTTPTRRATKTLLNPQKDEDGNEMELEITPRAAKRLSDIMAKDSNPLLALRIQVESGGCHGFQYIMRLETLPPSLPGAAAAASTPPPSPPSPQEASSNPPSKTRTAIIGEDDTIFAFYKPSTEDASPTAEPSTTAAEPTATRTAPPEVDGADGLQAPKIILDSASLELLKGSKLDYTMELIGSQFKIVDNPLATSSCGCGTSFDIKI